MEKLNKIVEAVVEKTVGRFLPEVEAKASGCHWDYGCCEGGSKLLTYQVCDTLPYIRNITCAGACPA